MLNGYLNLARFLNVTGKKEDKLQPEKIYQNGSNLSKAFLGSDNELTKRFKSQSAKNSTKFAEKSQTKPEIPNHTRPKSQVDLHIETSRIQKDSPECLSRRKSKEFIIKSTSGTFLTPRASEKTVFLQFYAGYRVILFPIRTRVSKTQNIQLTVRYEGKKCKWAYQLVEGKVLARTTGKSCINHRALRFQGIIFKWPERTLHPRSTSISCWRRKSSNRWERYEKER